MSFKDEGGTENLLINKLKQLVATRTNIQG